MLDQGSFLIAVRPGAIDPSSCKVSGDGRKKAETGKETELQIVSYDKWRNVRYFFLVADLSLPLYTHMKNIEPV